MPQLRIKSCLALGLAVWLAFAPSPAAAQGGGSGTGPVVDAIIARVNGEPLMLSQLKEAALDQQVPLESLELGGVGSLAWRRALTQLVDEQLLVLQAKQEGIELQDAQIARQVDEMLQELRNQLGGVEGLDGFLKERRLSLDALRKLLTDRERHRALAAQVIARRVQIGEGEVKEFEARRTAAGEPREMVNLSQILVACAPEDQQTKAGERAYSDALGLSRQAGARPQEFSKLATENTDDPQGAARGGWLGWIDPDALQPVLRQQVGKMKPGDISPPVLTPEGFHVLLLHQRRTARDLLYEESFAKARETLVSQLRDKADIKLFDLQGQPLAAE